MIYLLLFSYTFLSRHKLASYFLLILYDGINFLLSNLSFFSSSHLAAPFLNLMSNLEERSGGVLIRIGGNSQDYAVMVPSLANGSTFSIINPSSTVMVSY